MTRTNKLAQLSTALDPADIKRYRKLIGALQSDQGELISTSQVERVKRLTSGPQFGGSDNPHPTSLFPQEDEVVLRGATIVAPLGLEHPGEEDLLAQLLPYWAEEATDLPEPIRSLAWTESSLRTLSVSTAVPEVAERIQVALRTLEIANRSKSVQFARSAHYMGSKASLAPFFVEIIKTLLPRNTLVLDLMCGSGAAAGAFSNYWPTLASDAQSFSLNLATVQGGGMTAARAKELADRVLLAARPAFADLPAYVSEQIAIENEFLASDLSQDVIDELVKWIDEYPRIGNQDHFSNHPLQQLIEQRRINTKLRPYVLFTAYYANLFFGVRQAAEIDCLRAAIADIANDEDEKAWALGALICAVSSCAYTYGGHFAQPKLDTTDKAKFEKMVPEMLIARGLSVSHEFYARLTNLGEESEKTPYRVQSIKGPWENAIMQAEALASGRSVCVYLDPPYTRDEYSRYYHVLETLIKYNYPTVSDKPSMPRRGTASRFASEFATRNTALVQSTLTTIMRECLDRKWHCLWSYSSGGDVSVQDVLGAALKEGESIDIFSADYAYKAQGRHSAKSVKEYAILISPCGAD